MDHDWPPELESGPDCRCYNCGLRYDQWTDPETLWCKG